VNASLWRTAALARVVRSSAILPRSPAGAPAERWESARKPGFARSATRTIPDRVAPAPSACRRNGQPWPCCRLACREANTRTRPAPFAGTARRQSPAAQCAGECVGGGAGSISLNHFSAIWCRREDKTIRLLHRPSSAARNRRIRPAPRRTAGHC